MKAFVSSILLSLVGLSAQSVIPATGYYSGLIGSNAYLTNDYTNGYTSRYFGGFAPIHAYGHPVIAGQENYPAVPYVHKDIPAEEYKHEDIPAVEYEHEEIEAEPYVHQEPKVVSYSAPLIGGLALPQLTNNYYNNGLYGGLYNGLYNTPYNTYSVLNGDYVNRGIVAGHAAFSPYNVVNAAYNYNPYNIKVAKDVQYATGVQALADH